MTLVRGDFAAALIIFDCDGVLVDSEFLAAEVFASALQGYGVVMSPAECFSQFRGLTLSACLELLQQQRALPEHFIDELRLATELAFDKYLQASDGVDAILRQIASLGIEFCVASNGSLKKIHHALATTQLAHFFNGRVFSAEQVPLGKPAPDLFLLAAKTMGYRPDNCWVIEDSFSGVTAALAAKMSVVHFCPKPDEPHGLPNITADQRVECVRSMAELASYLG